MIIAGSGFFSAPPWATGAAFLLPRPSAIKQGVTRRRRRDRIGWLMAGISPSARFVLVSRRSA